MHRKCPYLALTDGLTPLSCVFQLYQFPPYAWSEQSLPDSMCLLSESYHVPLENKRRGPTTPLRYGCRRELSTRYLDLTGWFIREANGFVRNTPYLSLPRISLGPFILIAPSLVE